MADINNIDLGNKIYPKKELRKIATDQWEDLPTAIIVNEEVKEIKAKKEAGMKKMNKKAMTRIKTNFVETEETIKEEKELPITNQNAR